MIGPGSDKKGRSFPITDDQVFIAQAKRGEEGEGKWSRVMRKRGDNEENEDIEENEENHELELENPEEDGVLY